MKLLDATTHKVVEFPPDRIPRYAILSHTWGDDEVLYTDLIAPSPPVPRDVIPHTQKAGWSKILFTCRTALQARIEYCWIDTLCIDKSSSSELSESINSMFQWYQRATVCYVYLEDVDELSELAKARWFTRGWTLQELIAPTRVLFYSRDGKLLGEKTRLKETLPKITGIEASVLASPKQLNRVCVARKMSWASARVTTRPEDIAYCLLGLFGISMPTLYGEGGDKAFYRLQEEIIKSTDDQSLFAWTAPKASPFETSGLLAKEPSYFVDSGDAVAFRDWTSLNPQTVGSLGVCITVPLVKRSYSGRWEAVLNCRWRASSLDRVTILVQKTPGTTNHYQRIKMDEKHHLHWQEDTPPSQFYVRQDPVVPLPWDIVEPSLCILDFSGLQAAGYKWYAYFHGNQAHLPSNWHLDLLQQSMLEDDAIASFLVPGSHRRLAAAFLVEKLPEKRKLLLFLGTGANTSHPTVCLLASGFAQTQPPDGYIATIEELLADNDTLQAIQKKDVSARLHVRTKHQIQNSANAGREETDLKRQNSLYARDPVKLHKIRCQNLFEQLCREYRPESSADYEGVQFLTVFDDGVDLDRLAVRCIPTAATPDGIMTFSIALNKHSRAPAAAAAAAKAQQAGNELLRAAASLEQYGTFSSRDKRPERQEHDSTDNNASTAT